MENSLTTRIFKAVVASPKSDGGLDNEQQNAEPANFLRHVIALCASKIADGLINPKLVLSWLLIHLGAGSVWTSLLVPVRESLAMLPQIILAGRITARPIRKWFWVAGAVGQGICAAGILLAALTLRGQVAGAVIVGLLATLALARLVCSTSYKDILGKTVGTSRRGTATGFAASAAATAVIAFALILILGPQDRFVLVICAIGLAALCWIAGGVTLAGLQESPSEPDETGQAMSPLRQLWDAPQLRRFIVVRALLVGTALAPPYLVMLQDSGALWVLGALVLASAVASLLSSFVWGRLSDRSSRRVLIYAGVAGGAVLALMAALAVLGLADRTGVVPVCLVGLMIAYEGVRQGRSTQGVDMAGEGDRAAYTAVSNTVVGVFLLVAGGAFAALSSVSVPLVIGIFALMCWIAAILASDLEEMQNG